VSWLERVAALEALEDAPLDAALVAEFERAAPPGSVSAGRAIRFSTPTFKAYSSCELEGCGKNSFPAFSVTAGGCALDCDHCQAKILEPMISATSPEMLERKVRELVATQDLQGFLLSGGSNKKNEIRYERYYPVIERLKRDYPRLRIAIHSALLDAPRARAMADAGVDTAMMDVIGAQETIRDVYHLERPVADFEATLEALCATTMEVVPHIVIGLHYGRLLGEAAALDIVSRHRLHSLVLVVIMPFYAKPGTFVTPGTSDVGRIFLEARKRIPDQQVLLGCARPPGMHRRVTDAYAVMAGLDGIAFPADGAVAVAEAIGRPAAQQHACCSMKAGRTIRLHPSPALAA
jgi:lipoyl synthase